MNVLTDEAQKRSLARVDIPTLVQLAEEAIGQERFKDAILYLRTAVRRAPLRQDLRDMLVVAMDRSFGTGGTGPSIVADFPSRPPRKPLLEDDDDDEPSARTIEEIRLNGDDEDREESHSPHRRRSERGPIGQTFSSFGQRKRRGPSLTPILILLFVISAVIGGAALVYSISSGGEIDASEKVPLETDLPEATDEDVAILENIEKHLAEDEFQEAIDQINLLASGPDTNQLLVDSYTAWGKHFESEGLWSEASRRFEIAFELDPENAKLADSLGFNFFMQGRTTQPSDPEAARARYAEARKHLEAGLEIAPEDVQILYNLARVAFVEFRDEDGAGYLNRIITLKPDSATGRKALEDLKSKGLKIDG